MSECYLCGGTKLVCILTQKGVPTEVGWIEHYREAFPGVVPYPCPKCSKVPYLKILKEE